MVVDFFLLSARYGSTIDWFCSLEDTLDLFLKFLYLFTKHYCLGLIFLSLNFFIPYQLLYTVLMDIFIFLLAATFSTVYIIFTLKHIVLILKLRIFLLYFFKLRLQIQVFSKIFMFLICGSCLIDNGPISTQI